ncbi:hypothetical protein GCM10011371_19340 [Novosphingobium marinum]|uniref:GDT1 family protein n=1 Tax=Novosphingobium marinum TaxID=1514948 RepID=A0A7Y9XWW1_9SPHN|nr:hypothetical protein [Novosphingobium marinum]NYH96047.1 hypothetical protein [Novosphingobium marinum]GGC32017.1 hypothetical protein GCM10011371_19340 [Novosphingobium marinum]
MSAFYLTLLAVVLTGWGARDQLALAGMTAAGGRRPAALAIACVLAVATAAAAAFAATLVAPVLPPDARRMLAAIALALSGVELVFLVSARKTPREPTRSLGAFAIVVLAHQLTDAARFLVFAVAVATNAPVPAGIAGAVGGVALLAIAWFEPGVPMHGSRTVFRRIVGVVLLLIASGIALNVLGFL